MTSSDDPTLAVVLSGGGARGAFEAGVLEAVEDAGLWPTIVSGTSAGAITGAGIACGWDAARLSHLWCSLESRHVIRVRMDLQTLIRPQALLVNPKEVMTGRPTWADALLDLFGWTWLFDLAPLRELLVEALDGELLPVRDDMTLVLSAVEVATGRSVRFSNRPPLHDDVDVDGGAETIVTDLTVDHLLASAAIPGLFRPTAIDGTEYWDGVLRENTPVSAALAHQPDRVLVVGPVPDNPPARPPGNFGDVLALALGHVLRDALVDDVRMAVAASDHVGLGPDADRAPVQLASVVPEAPIQGLGDLLDFEPSVSRDLVESGRARTAAVLDEHGWAS